MDLKLPLNNLIKFYSMGEAIDKIEKGKIAISLEQTDVGTIIGVDEDNWLWAYYPGSDSITYDFNFKLRDDVKEERWIILDEPKNLFVKTEKEEQN